MVRMKIEDLFRIGEKTIFTGTLDTNESVLENVICEIRIDGKIEGEMIIEGEVHTRHPQRDLWTASEVALSRDIVRDHDVWLISKSK